MSAVKPKKHLGQHFLTDKHTAHKIVDALQPHGHYNKVLEVGPGMGILSDRLFMQRDYETWLIDIDQESIAFLKDKYDQMQERIIYGDFLSFDFGTFTNEPIAVIGNFPYNISSQILFKILAERDCVAEVVGMFQKEVAVRCTAKPGGKTYGILSVLLQAYYTVEYLFTVKPGVFNPPPKVQSGVIRLKRNAIQTLDCDEDLFARIVKMAFNQRRKTLRNALSSLIVTDRLKEQDILNLRAERLNVQDFVDLTNLISTQK